MDIYNLIRLRSSVRTYKTDPVPVELVLKIVEAAGMAPSWANKQCWRFIIIDSHVHKKIIGQASGQANIAKACETAPYIIVLCSDPEESGRKNDIEYFVFDCALAMENLMLAAQAEGLSTCVVGWFDEKAIKGLLNIPDRFKVIAFTPLGYSNEKESIRKRKKISEIVYHNHWGKSL